MTKGGICPTREYASPEKNAVAELRLKRDQLKSDIRKLLYSFTAETDLVANGTIEVESVANSSRPWRYKVEIKVEI